MTGDDGLVRPGVAALTPVPAALRAALRQSDGSSRTHALAWARIPALAEVEVEPPPRPRAVGPELTAVAWNLERGRDPGAAARLLARSGAQVALLTEMDVGMARSGQRHTVRDLARALGWGYAFAVEYVELDRGNAAERRAWQGHEDEAGLHGCAIASGAPLLRPALVRLERRGDWFDGRRGERRVGGRVALLAQLELGDGVLTLAAVHLESYSDPDDRAVQLAVLLDAIERYDCAAPVLIGGDLNTLSLAAADLEHPERIARALDEAPDRWTNPVPHEPLFARAAAAGYRWDACNRLDQGTHRHPVAPVAAGREGPTTRRGPMHWDWFLARGLACRDPRVLDALDPGGAALSDHEAIAVTVRPPPAARTG